MNSLFSQFFTKFGGVFFEVYETIVGRFGRYLGGVLQGFQKDSEGKTSTVRFV